MRKTIVKNFSIYEDQVIDLRLISKNNNGQYMSRFVRKALDVAIKKEKLKEQMEEVFDYT